MDLREYKVVFLVVTAIVALLVASPALSRLLVFPRTEFFSEMYILGSNHTAENYPFNVSSGQSYGVTLGLGNQLGYSAYYLVEVKFRNESELGPNGADASSLPSLYNVSAFVADQATWELPLTFGFDYSVDASVPQAPQVMFNSLAFNDVVLDLGGLSAAWNSSRSGCYGNLFFELWIYNETVSSFQFHQRAVWLWLNMTV